SQQDYVRLRLYEIRIPKFAIRNSPNHFVSFYLSRKQRQTDRADHKQGRPRRPKRRLVQDNFAPNAPVKVRNVSGSLNKRTKKSGSHVFHQRTQANDISPARREEIVYHFSKYRRDKEESQQRSARYYPPLHQRRDRLRQQRQQQNPNH